MPSYTRLTSCHSYFSRYTIDFYSKDQKLAKYITTDQDLLEKYYAVGGVRIEDDILVTEDGYENLTTAPKGEEALKIINGADEDVVELPKKRWFW
jgi:Xaa-Pro dipeptidase